MESLLKTIYFDPHNTAGYSSHDKLYNEAIKSDSSVRRANINKFLSGEDSYTLYRNRRKKFNTARTFASCVDYSWQTDLCDVSNLSEFNDGIRYLLFCIDVYSRYVWVVPLVNKKSDTTTRGFIEIFNQGRIPGYIVSDSGTEFRGSTKSYLDKLNITQYTLHGPSKCGMVERVQKTIKAKVYRYLYAHNTKRYIDILPVIIDTYNNTFHRIIKTTPNEKAKSRDYKSTISTNMSCLKKNKKFTVGDYVRVSRQSYVFEKAYEGSFNIEIFQIARVLCRDGLTVYHIKDLNNELIKGVFYNNELQKVEYQHNRVYKIEKILSTKIIKGKKYFKVRWLGYGKRFDSLIPSDDLINV